MTIHMQVVEFDVMEKDIEQGKPGLPRNCPVARAIKKRIKSDVKVSVCGPDISFIYGDGELFSAITPHNALRFILRFDDGRPVKPFSFQVQIPCEFLK